jgi:hypothetical protein
MCTKFWLGSLKGRDHSEDLGSLVNRVWSCGSDTYGSGCGPVASYCEHGNILLVP